MKIANSSAFKCSFFSATVILLALYSVGPETAHAQTINSAEQGDNAVWLNSTHIAGSSAFIDASAFTTATDICAKIAAALTTTASFPAGGVIDARGAFPTGTTRQVCANSPSSTLTSQPPAATILLPAGTIILPVPWVLADQTRIIGEGREQTTISTETTSNGSKNFSGSALIQMGSSSWCPSTGCTGVVVAEMFLEGNGSVLTATVDGIDNAFAGEFSQVESVTVSDFTGNGLLVQGAVASGLADNSGPYSNLAISNISGDPTSTTSCIDLEAQTHGIHGLTCTSNGNPTAGIYLDGSGNTIEDVHFEGVIAGVLVGSQHVAAADSIINISGVDGGNSGPVTYDIQISSNTQSGGAPNVSDLTLIAISPFGTIKSYVVQDNLTGINIPKTDNVALYALGDPFGSGYTLFSTSPVTPSSSVPTNGLPTWGVGTTNLGTTDSCDTPGALYSNTSGGSGSTVFVCTESTGTLSWQPIS
jgi:hypothetical protein